MNDTKKCYFQENTRLENKIQINDLIKNKAEQLTIIGEFLLFLIAISSKINNWIDKIDEMDSEIVSKYELFLEKFFYLNDFETPGDHNNYNTNNSMANQYIRHTSLRRSIINHCDNDYSDLFTKRTSGAVNFDFEKDKLQRLVNELEKEKTIYMDKYNDSIREIEILKENNAINLTKIEELLKENLKTSEFKRLFELKDQEYKEMKNSKEAQIKFLKDEKDKLLDSLDIAKDKSLQMQLIQNESEKLKLKLKELSHLKDKNTENETLLATIDSKERIIDTLSKENSLLLAKLEKIEEELTNEKKKYLLINKDYETLKANFTGLNEDFSRLKKFCDRKSIKFEDESKIALDDIYSDGKAQNEIHNRQSNLKGFYNKQVKKQNLLHEYTGDEDDEQQLEDQNFKKFNPNADKTISRKYNNSHENQEKDISLDAINDVFEINKENEGIPLNCLIGDRLSVMNSNNAMRKFKGENRDNYNFMSLGSWNTGLNKKCNFSKLIAS